MSDESLFRDRVPEAAARQLATVLAWLTECELATFERYRLRKSTPASTLRRHQEICATAVMHCRELGVQPKGLNGGRCVRLAAALTDGVSA